MVSLQDQGGRGCSNGRAESAVVMVGGKGRKAHCGAQELIDIAIVYMCVHQRDISVPPENQPPTWDPQLRCQKPKTCHPLPTKMRGNRQ